MKSYTINSARLFKALAYAEKKRVDKLIRKARFKQAIKNLLRLK